jgi:very long chain acyl-CoA dehydrogenase
VHNLFRGQVEHSQVFPYPNALNQEQVEYVGAFVDPVSKFFAEVNNADRNDMNAVR